MTTTTYYNLNIVEGTDIVNPLIVDNPNYEKIDETMHDNAVAGVTLATEIANATVHAITRENSDCAVIRFIATSVWKAGDTATVDGVPVTALLPSGETLPDGAYVINANVLCILTGTNLTIYAERKKAENANEIAYNDTTVGAELVKLDGEVVRLDEEIGNVNSNLIYADLMESIGFSSNNITLYNAYKENGIVILQVSAPSGVTGVFNAKIGSAYAPRVKMYGALSHPSNSNDIGKVASASIDSNGTISMWVASQLNLDAVVQFMYPLKNV